MEQSLSYFLGVDVGTSSCKVCVIDASGRTIGNAGYGYRTYSPADGWAEQEPSDWLVAVVRAVHKVIEETRIDPSRVRLLTLTSAAHIGVLADGDGKPLRRAILWNDQRSSEEAQELANTHGELILARTFNRVSTTWTLSHLAWVRKHEPEVWRQVRRIYLSKDFIMQWLTGETSSDPATALSSLLYDAVSHSWSEQLCELAGFSPDILPTVRPANAVCGSLLPRIAHALHLPLGTPVVNGTLDSGAENYGAGACRPGDFVIRLGTAGGVHLVKSEPRPDPRLITYPHPVDRLWYSQAGTNAAGSSIAWAANALGGMAEYTYAELIDMASRVPPGCDGLLFHPFLSGERCPYWDSLIRGNFSGISFRHGPGHFARAVMEGVVFSLKDAFLAIVEEAVQADNIRVVGGGIANPLLTEILSDVLGRSLILLPQADSAYGAALLGFSMAEHEGSNTPCGRPEAGDSVRVLPRKAYQDIYEDAFAAYRDLCSHLQAVYHAKPFRKFQERFQVQ